MKHHLQIPLLVLLCLVLSSTDLHAQYYFGKNKVRYTDFDWQRMTTPHFHIYFYPEERRIAEIGARLAEESYTLLERKLTYTLHRRIPLIFYSSSIHFQQTNTIPALLPEDVGGFMEFAKGRVVIPYTGSVAEFKHVIRHELVHVFTCEKLKTITAKHRIYNFYLPPLWFNEGLAEYWSQGWDSTADMVIRDALYSGTLVSIQDMALIEGSFKMYKEGQSILKYIAEKYGEDKISLIFENWWRSEDFESVFRSATGVSLKKLNEEWRYWLQKQYFPRMGTAEAVSEIATKLTHTGMNLQPVIVTSPVDSTAESFLFISNRMGYFNICRQGFSQPGAEKIIKGERTAEFESFHPQHSRLSVNRQQVLAFVSRRGERDALYLWDISRHRLIRKFAFEPLLSLFSPSWSPDGEQLAFCAQDTQGVSDLYILSVKDGGLQKLTNDLYSEREPSWFPDGQQVVFSSDRNRPPEHGYYNLFIYQLSTGEIKPLTWGRHNDLSPAWSPDGLELAFSSDRDGGFNLYLLDENLECKRITNILTGAFSPCWFPDGKQLLFCAFEKGSFQIYRFSLPQQLTVVEPTEPETTGEHWTFSGTGENCVQRVVPYQRKFSLDLAQSVIAYDPELGPVGGLGVAVTDMLGDHHYYFFLSNTAGTRRDLLRNMNIAVVKADLTRRWSKTLGVFHLAGYSLASANWIHYRRYGGFFTLSYPFSKFTRLQTDLVFRHCEGEEFFGGLDPEGGLLFSTYIGYTKDNSLWGTVGPIDGERYNLTLGQTVDIEHHRIHYFSLLADWRRYLRLSRRNTLALKLFARSSHGRRPQRFFSGGSWSFRGYRLNSIGGHHLLLLSGELRYPLIDQLLIKFPWIRLWLRDIRGTLFVDIGNGWDNAAQMRQQGLLGSLGIGARLRLSHFVVLRLDFSRQTDFRSLSKNTRSEFSFGWDF